MLRQMYDDHLEAELPPRLATKVDRLRALALMAETQRDCKEIAVMIRRMCEVLFEKTR
jgi:hypothetical protein